MHESLRIRRLIESISGIKTKILLQEQIRTKLL